MNASDIIKAKRNQTLYKAYYNPTIFPGTAGNGNSTLVVSTTNYYPVSSVSTSLGWLSSFTSCVNTQYLYECEPTFISYQLAYDVNGGEYICGGKVPSFMTWKANPSIGTIPIYASTGSTIESANTFAVRPEIFTNPEFYQGTNFDTQCYACNNFGNNNTCCHNCASGQ